ncbi:MAG: serpin family protein [Planctomycetota bacterium]
MWRKITLSAMALGLVGLSPIWAEKKPVDANDPDIAKDKQAVVQSNNEFAIDLYGKLSAREGNLFFSPYSISTALAMAYAGARNETAKQMATTLHFNLESDRLAQACAELIKGMAPSKPEDYQINIANALWGQQDYKFLPGFLDLNNKYYKAGLNPVDFLKATEEARQTINKWVEVQTNDKIKDLIQKGVLTPDTKLVLTNAIYFKGNWMTQFDKNKTVDADFNLADKTKVKTPMMELRDKKGFPIKIPIMRNTDFMMIKLPYNGKELSMLIILPHKYDGISACEKLLTAENINKWQASLAEEKLPVYLPKFKLTLEFELSDMLKSLGMSDAFGYPQADFSGMGGTKELFIDNVIHKAFIEVNEEGTEAAAATAVIAPTGAPPKAPSVFRVDHPFIFLIRDERSGSILFMGRVMNPKAE